MPKGKKSKSKGPARFKRLGTRLDAFEAQLKVEGSKALDRLEQHQTEFEGLIGRVRQELPDAREAFERLVQRLRTGIDTLKVKFALGRAEARDAYAEQSARIQAVIDDVEKALEHERDGDAESFRQTLLGQIDRLEHEVAALQIQLIAVGQQARAGFEKAKQEIEKQLTAMRGKIEEAAAAADDRLDALEKDLDARWGTLKKTIAALFERGEEKPGS